MPTAFRAADSLYAERPRLSTDHGLGIPGPVATPPVRGMRGGGSARALSETMAGVLRQRCGDGSSPSNF
jgi:hypothetical protein